MNLLVDTSVWIDHFRRNSFHDLLAQGDRVVMHPGVLGELACGTLPNRARTVAALRWVFPAVAVNDEDVHYLIESRGLWGKGIGWVDAALLAAALLGKYEFWTYDKRLDAVARQLGIPTLPRA
ncbi:MAG: PIN domain-containing protein [Bryobacteraceae bacterium]|nr:PIN domain-containing protein [Bryobacteraceae bacterium]